MALFAQLPRVLISIEINANCRFCMISWFENKHEDLGPKSFIYSERSDSTFYSCFLSKIEFCEVQKQKGKLVFSKSGVFNIWHIVSSVAQRQNIVNFHKLACI